MQPGTPKVLDKLINMGHQLRLGACIQPHSVRVRRVHSGEPGCHTAALQRNGSLLTGAETSSFLGRQGEGWQGGDRWSRKAQGSSGSQEVGPDCRQPHHLLRAGEHFGEESVFQEQGAISIDEKTCACVSIHS